MLNKYTLPGLPYSYSSLEPYISEEQLMLHYEKHHKAYIDGANAVLERLESSRKKNEMPDIKSSLKELSWNIGGHILHSLYWGNLAPQSKAPKGVFLEEVEREFGSFERFRLEFSNAASSVEGSGWAALAFCKKTGRLMNMQIEKHNVNIIPTFGIVLVIDMFEHAYYVDYRNEKAKYIESFWKIADWDEANKRIEEIKGR